MRCLLWATWRCLDYYRKWKPETQKLPPSFSYPYGTTQFWDLDRYFTDIPAKVVSFVSPMVVLPCIYLSHCLPHRLSRRISITSLSVIFVAFHPSYPLLTSSFYPHLLLYNQGSHERLLGRRVQSGILVQKQQRHARMPDPKPSSRLFPDESVNHGTRALPFASILYAQGWP